MIAIIEQIVWTIRIYISNEYTNLIQRQQNDQRIKMRFYIAIILLPILLSYIFIQMQSDINTQNYTEDSRTTFGIYKISYIIWNSTSVGVASFVLSIWHFMLRIVGITLGIGLGLGFAGHVYDALSDAQDTNNVSNSALSSGALRRRNSETTTATSTTTVPNIPKDTSKQGVIQDVNSYHSLMRIAGYSVDNGTLRAQMVRGPQATVAIRANNAKRELKLNQLQQTLNPSIPLANNTMHNPRISLYKFDKGNTASMRMKCMWPNLSSVINDSLAKLTEFVLRDYVSSWYSKVDEHVVYTDPEDKKKEYQGSTNDDGTRRPSTAPLERSMSKQGSFRSSTEGGADNNTDLSIPNRSSSFTTQHSASSLSNQQRQQKQRVQQQQQRTMVLTTTGTQPSPFIDSLYSSFAYLLGMLATRASENVNILELILLHFPHILGQNLRIYREMKNLALEKKRRRVATEREKWRNKNQNPSSPRSSMTSSSEQQQQEGGVSEIAIVREYLLAGRLHRAVIFGLDVPSLLFADPLGKDCPPGPSYQGNSDCDRLNGHPDEDAILHDRVLSPESSLIDECELDYCRVLASKLAKMSVPKTEVESSIVRTMLVEMLASCVLTPVMGCFCPDSVNRWIITGLGLLENEAGEASASVTSTTDDNTSVTDGMVRVNSDIDTTQSVMSDEMSRNCSTSVVSEREDYVDNIVGGVMEEITSVGSAASEMESLFGLDDDDESTRKSEVFNIDNCSKDEQIITLLSMSIIELGGFVDFEECRYAREHSQDTVIDWDAQKCRDSVRHLVLVIEAALLFGVRTHPKRQFSSQDRATSEFEIEATLEEHDVDEFEVDIDEGLVEPKVTSSVHQNHFSLSAILMELTGDIDAFERLVGDGEEVGDGDDDSLEDEHDVELSIPKPNELSTLRTLIAAWLHTGQAYKVLSIVVRARKSILRRFYHKNAFLRKASYASDFTRLLRQLDGVDILVDTMAVLASQCLLVDNGFDGLMKSFQKIHLRPKHITQQTNDPFPEMIGRKRRQPNNSMSVVGSVKANFANNRDRIARFAQSAAEIDINPFKDRGSSVQKSTTGAAAGVAYSFHQNNHGTTPAYLAFSRNDVFASSLRSERERRSTSWMREIKGKKNLEFVSRTKGLKDKDIMMHRELHHLSRFFYTNSNEIHIEPCSSGGGDNQSVSAATLSATAGNIIVKAVGTRRKVEVPDEDSSFLLRAQPRPLKPVALQRDHQNPDVACKVYCCMYEEPAIHPRTKRFYGGRYLRQCLMRYYPSDRTASVVVANKISVLDNRTQEGSNQHLLTSEFQKLRHTCLKVGHAAGGLLSSPLMEPGDFCSTPRSGRALDFAHRVSLFEKPMVELGGKKFVVHDAASSHRADASSLELSDASMTAAIILRGQSGLNVCDVTPGGFNIKVSDDGTPLVLLRASRDGSSGGSPKAKDEARPYRPSFLRAALLVKSSKQEAQSQCLLHCIRSGSARSSTKIKSDEWLQPTLRLLQYANSRRQEEQSVLLRDLQFGMNHIDRGQLSRNVLLNPRYPTILRGLNTKIEGLVEVKATSDFDLLGSPGLLLFRIRCTAIAEYIGEDDDSDEFVSSSSVDDSDENNKTKKGKTRYYREEWTILRSLRDFSLFHKHIKGQVAQSEHSASTSAKLVGSVSAALTIVGGNTTANDRERGPLVPSLSQATKAGNLGLSSKKVMEKRKKLLDQYLKYLVSPNNLLSRCPELLRFLGAETPLISPDASDKMVDEYGREDIRRVELVTDKLKAGIVQVKRGTEQVSVPDNTTMTKNSRTDVSLLSSGKAESMDDNITVSTLGTTTAGVQEEFTPPKDKSNQQNHAAVRMARIRAGEIRLKDVRRSIFRLLKHLFDLDNASFFRSRVISVIKTMSVAVAGATDFHQVLFNTHANYMNGEWISGWIHYLIDMFWPNGMFYTKEPPPSEEELFDQKQNSKKMLEKMFPDQLKTVLGKHTEDGLELLHEMLQNRLVLKSMAYMIMEEIWVELFPELGDFVSGTECLEKAA